MKMEVPQVDFMRGIIIIPTLAIKMCRYFRNVNLLIYSILHRSLSQRPLKDKIKKRN